MTGYWLLFWSALLAATLIPAQSEALLAGLIVHTPAKVGLLVIVATLGNTLGSMVNWALGRYLAHFQNHVWFPFKPTTIEKAQLTFNRYGIWILLLSWLPIVGDPLTLVAGLMRIPLWQFILLVLIAKAGRYIVIAALVLNTL